MTTNGRDNAGKQLAPGMVAPDFTLLGDDSQPFTLSQPPQDFVIVLFYRGDW